MWPLHETPSIEQFVVSRLSQISRSWWHETPVVIVVTCCTCCPSLQIEILSLSLPLFGFYRFLFNISRFWPVSFTAYNFFFYFSKNPSFFCSTISHQHITGFRVEMKWVRSVRCGGLGFCCSSSFVRQKVRMWRIRNFHSYNQTGPLSVIMTLSWLLATVATTQFVLSWWPLGDALDDGVQPKLPSWSGSPSDTRFSCLTNKLNSILYITHNVNSLQVTVAETLAVRKGPTMLSYRMKTTWCRRTGAHSYRCRRMDT